MRDGDQDSPSLGSSQFVMDSFYNKSLEKVYRWRTVQVLH